MKRIKHVVLVTIHMLLVLNFILTPIILSDCYVKSIPPEWDYFLYVNIYAIICSVTFGYMDKPKLENIILIVILILSLLIWLIPNEFSTQSQYIFFGFLLGRKLVLFVDMSFKSIMNNEKNKRIRIGETKVAEVKVEEQDINGESNKKDSTRPEDDGAVMV
jgi:hypothetical protein